MIDYIKQNHLGLVIIVWLVISSFMGGGDIGAIARDTTTITNPFNFQQGMTSTTGTFTGAVKVGSSGTAHTVIISGTCDILGASSITATTTGFADCVATGIVTGDKIFFSLATTSPSAVGAPLGLFVMGANASSTSGFITFSIANYTGANAIPDATALFGSSTQYWVVR